MDRLVSALTMSHTWQTYKLGDPSSPDTNLGPVVSLAAADRIRRQIFEAEVAGARKLVDEKIFTAAHV
jgi:acyl-CoA reductase-like NAD-dependent aldehyde dehydrogenase